MKRALGAGIVLLVIDGAAAQAQDVISTPTLLTARNFRDIAGVSAAMGGTGLANATTNDGVMRTGVFYRSNRLLLSPADAATVANLGITTDIDMRSSREIAAAPDTVPAGVKYINIDVFGTSNPANFTKMYQNFVANDTVRNQLGAVLLDLAHATGPAVIHCEFGKDRTGWVSAVLESIAGVSSKTIMSDYLASNTYLGFNGVEARNLQTALDQVTTSYGSLQAYLTQGLGLSQADIYVLRAKMVYYKSLPGQSGFVGNAAQGGAFLNSLQNSPLSGTYTAFNYFLQSAVDAGSLDGMEQRAGGQIHADAAAYLLREPRRINQAISDYTSGTALASGRTILWQADLGQDMSTSAGSGSGASRERNLGILIGLTHRFGEQASGYVSAGYNWGNVSELGLGAHADVNAFVSVAGLRYGFKRLETGPYIAASVNFEAFHYGSARALGDGLGTARGSSSGHVLAGAIDVGSVISVGHSTVTPHVGVGATQVTLGGFGESDSELALSVQRISVVRSHVEAGFKARFAPIRTGAWAITPTVDVNYIRFLDRPDITSNASLYGFGVAQGSSFDSRNLTRIALGFSGQHGPFSLSLGGDGSLGDGARSRGYGGRVVLGYSF
jgi:protein-tyrosine phosphatase